LTKTRLEILLRARNILSAHWLARFSILDAHNQSSAFLAAHLGRRKVAHIKVVAKSLKTDPRKFRELTLDAHHEFSKVEIVRAVNKLSSLERRKFCKAYCLQSFCGGAWYLE